MKESTKRKAKIVYLVNQFYMHGGVQRMLSHKIDAWIDNYEYEVLLITLNQGEHPIVYPPNNSFRLVDLGLKGVNRHHIRDLWRFVHKLKRIIRKESPDLIITTLTGISSLILPLVCPKVKKVLEIHSSGELSVTKSWKYKWLFLNRYHRVVLLNEDEKKYYRLSNLIVIPNFIKSDDARLLNYNNRDKVIVAGGRIHPDKQYHHLIQIWEKVFSKYPDWCVEIYGDGDPILLEEYNKYVEIHKIERITFKPATEQLYETLSNSSLLCLTSDTESFSLILAEAKNAMLPVISYDCPNGPRHIIKDDGVLVEHNNIDQFAEELARLMENDDLRKELAEKAYDNRAIFSSIEIMKKWNRLI